MLPASGNLPPIHAYLTPEEVADHYRRHQKGLKGGVALMGLVGFFFPIYTAAVGGQLSRIRGMPTTVLNAQLLGGGLAGLFLALPTYFFAATVYRPDRSPELIQLLSNISWIMFAMPFACLLVQDLAFSYAILLDDSPKPLYPRWLSFVTTALTLTFWPTLGVHCVHSGAVAWNGALGFWVVGVGGGLQICIVGFYTLLAARRTDIPPDWLEIGCRDAEGESGLNEAEIESLVSKILESKLPR